MTDRETLDDRETPDDHDAGGPSTSTAVAGVVAAATGATAIPQALGLFANVAQAASLARSDLLFVANIVIAALGLIALFGPGHGRYRKSLRRVVVTAVAVIVCGILAGIGLHDRLNGHRSPDNERPVVPSITCTPASCSTSQRQLPLSGEFRRELAEGHELVLFLEQSGRHFPHEVELGVEGRWTATAYVGSDTGRESAYTYQACLYDIDGNFAANLRELTDDQRAQGLVQLPTSGAASMVVCREVYWVR